jgi:hypothetical protein
LRNPITGIDDCCSARAATGHPAAAQPASVMNSRRLIASPRAEDNIGWAKNITVWDRELCRSLHRSSPLPCPLYPQRQTSELGREMSALCQKQTFGGLFDHLVGQLLQMQGHIEPSAFAVLRLITSGCLNRQLAWFCALEDAIDIRRRTPVLIGNIRTVRDQAAGFRE